RTEPAESQRRSRSRGTDRGGIDISTQRVHRRLDRIDKQSMHAQPEDQQRRVVANVELLEEQGACRSAGATGKKWPTGPEARDRDGTAQRADYAAHVVRREP